MADVHESFVNFIHNPISKHILISKAQKNRSELHSYSSFIPKLVVNIF